MKKKLLIFSLFALLLLQSCGVENINSNIVGSSTTSNSTTSSSTTGTSEIHIHKNVLDSHHNATCIERGYDIYRCSECGAIEKRYVGSFGKHSLVHYDAVPASFEADGSYEYYKCEICNQIFWDSEGEQPASSLEIIILKKKQFETVGDTTYEYDLNGNIIKEWYPAGGKEDLDIVKVLMEYKYDNQNQKIKETWNYLGEKEEVLLKNVRSFEYDSNNEIKKVTTEEYNKDGILVSKEINDVEIYSLKLKYENGFYLGKEEYIANYSDDNILISSSRISYDANDVKTYECLTELKENSKHINYYLEEVNNYELQQGYKIVRYHDEEIEIASYYTDQDGTRRSESILNDDFKKVETKTDYYSADNTLINSRTEYYNDSNQKYQEVNVTYLNGVVDVKGVTEYTYNDNGLEIKKETAYYDSANQYTGKGIYETKYNDKNEVNYTSSFKYDKDDNLTYKEINSIIYYSKEIFNSSIIEDIYDEEKNTLTRNTYNLDKVLLNTYIRSKNGDETTETTTTYNTDGTLESTEINKYVKEEKTRREYYVYKDSKLYYSMIYIYENGDVMTWERESHRDDGDIEKSTINYTYENGRVVKETNVRYLNNEFFITEVYNYSYEGENRITSTHYGYDLKNNICYEEIDGIIYKQRYINGSTQTYNSYEYRSYKYEKGNISEETILTYTKACEFTGEKKVCVYTYDDNGIKTKAVITHYENDVAKYIETITYDTEGNITDRSTEWL